MTSLLDIAPITETVEIRGTKLVLHGIINRDMAALMRRFPLLAKQASAMPALNGEDALVASFEMMPAFIAAGLGQLGNDEIEAAVEERLSSAEMLSVLAVVMRLTNPGQQIVPLAGAAGDPGLDQSGADPATK